MRRIVRGVVGLVVVLGLVAAGVAFYYFNYSPDRTIHPLRGIDVSHHQGVVDWGKVAKSDVAFAILKEVRSRKGSPSRIPIGVPLRGDDGGLWPKVPAPKLAGSASSPATSSLH